MEPLVARLNALRSRWHGASTQTRMFVISAASVVMALMIFGYARASETHYDTLFAGLEPEEAASVIERLREMNVPYRLEDAGTTIQVPANQVHESRLTLAADGLPGGGVGFELFDEQRFGESEFAEQVQFRRALEGELARTIRHMAGVDNARVHLVLPQRSLFTSSESHASASVALHLRPGIRLRDDQVRGIVNLVAGSVRDLQPGNVTVVDGAGRQLAAGGSSEDAMADEAASSMESARERVETAREAAAQELLDRALGPGAAMVEVSADMMFTREERVEERYDPDRVATRSFQIVSEGGSAGDDGTQGVPGAVSALPGGPAAESLGGPGGSGGGSRSEVRNFEITKLVRREVEPVGRINRLQAAVIVDGIWEGEGEARSFTPRSDEELQRIETIVATAVGLNTERGDTISVVCVPLAELPPADAVMFGSDGSDWTTWIPTILLALVVAAALIAFALMMRRNPQTELARSADPALPAGQEGPSIAELMESTSTDGEELRALVVEIVRSEPETAARVLRSWISEGAND